MYDIIIKYQVKEMVMKKIIIYGCDNSGKTTLAETLSKELGYKYLHSPGNVSVEEMEAYINNFNNSTESLISDRFPLIEEYVYGYILRGEDRLSYKNWMSDLVNADLLVYCNPGKDVIKNWGDREQMDGVKDEADLIIDRYEFVTYQLKKLGLNVKEYDYTKYNYKDLLGGLIEHN